MSARRLFWCGAPPSTTAAGKCLGSLRTFVAGCASSKRGYAAQQQQQTLSKGPSGSWRGYHPTTGTWVTPKESKYDVIVVGGGHNGLVSAAYLGKQGLNVL
eukprot:gene18240-5116_t